MPRYRMRRLRRGHDDLHGNVPDQFGNLREFQLWALLISPIARCICDTLPVRRAGEMAR